MSLVTRLARAYEKLGGNLSKLPKDIQYRLLADEIAHPTLDNTSSYGRWLKLGTAALAATSLANGLPAVVHAEEKVAEKHFEIAPDNLSLYNYAFGVGKRTVHNLLTGAEVDLGEDTASVRLTRDGLEYTIHRPIPNNFYGASYKISSGLIKYGELQRTVDIYSDSQRRIPGWIKFLDSQRMHSEVDFRYQISVEFLTKFDKAKRLLREAQKLREGGDLVKSDERLKDSDKLLPIYSVARIERGLVDHMDKYYPKSNTSISQGESENQNASPKLENRLAEFTVQTKQGRIYARADGGTIYYTLKDGNGQTLREGLMDKNMPRDSLERVVSVEAINHFDKEILKKEGLAIYQQELKTERVKAVRNWLLRVSPNFSVFEDKVDWGLIAEGLIPVIYFNDSLVGVQFKGEYIRVDGGSDIIEMATGLVINKKIDDQSMVHAGLHYQHRHDIKTGLDFGAVSGTFSYKRKKLKISAYIAEPITKPQRIRSEHSSSTTTTETIHKHVRSYAELRRVAEFEVEYQATDDLALRLGAFYHAGKSGYHKEDGNITRIREGVKDDIGAIIGLNHTLPYSKILGTRTDLDIEARIGRAWEVLVRLSFSLPVSYEDKGDKQVDNIVDLLTTGKLGKMRIMYYDVTELRKENATATTSPITASCSGSPNPADIGQLVTWTAIASGGAGSFNHSWTGTDGLSGTTNPITKTYSVSGTKEATDTITSGSQTQLVNCSIAVSTAPSLSINNVSLTEGNIGTKNATLTVTLSAASGAPVTVQFATANGTATAGSDYTATSGTLTFNPGETNKTITVQIIGDEDLEGNETVLVNLSNPTNATIADNQGVVTILNDDAG